MEIKKSFRYCFHWLFLVLLSEPWGFKEIEKIQENNHINQFASESDFRINLKLVFKELNIKCLKKTEKQIKNSFKRVPIKLIFF